MMRYAIILLSFASAIAAAEPPFSLTYSPLSAEKSSRVVAKLQAFSPDAPLEPHLVATSPHAFAQSKLVQTDAAKVPYERETAHIEVTGPQIKSLYIEVVGFRTIQVTWVTDRILVITRDIGHVAGTEEVIDVVERKWLSQWQIGYRYETK